MTLSVATFPVISTFESVVVPVTESVFPNEPEPAILKSSNPIESSVRLPETTRSPMIEVLPVILVLPSTNKSLSTRTLEGIAMFGKLNAKPELALIVVQFAVLVAPYVFAFSTNSPLT